MERVPERDAAEPAADTPRDDRVVAALRQVADEYRAVREEADATAHVLAATRADNEKLETLLAHQRRELAFEQQMATRERERAAQLAAQLQDIHRSLFRADVYDLILRACLTLTGATRGAYLTAAHGDGPLRVRAAHGIGATGQEPSPFARALAERVLRAEDETFTYNSPEDFAALTTEIKNTEFRNCITASVVLLRDLDGVLIAADKEGGDFDADDADMLVHVGSQAGAAVENARLRRELEEAYRTVIGVLADAMRAKDPYTHGHSASVARLALRIARHLDLSPEECNVACYGALLHDIGKIGISDGVLNKPGTLLPEERELVRAHVRIGHDLLRRVPALVAVGHVLLHHHEWYDGNGYPDGLVGESIPLIARIVAVVDCYSAMTTKRSYKEALTHDEARAELMRCAGTQFDPRVVGAFLAVDDAPEPDADDDDPVRGLLPGFAHLRDSDPTNDGESGEPV